MTMKKFVNDPKEFVPEMLKGIALGEPGHAEVRARVQPDHADRRAERLTRSRSCKGSGSGHEPAHVMIVGKGMLDAACPGRRVRGSADGLRAGDDEAAQLRRRACST